MKKVSQQKEKTQKPIRVKMQKRGVNNPSDKADILFLPKSIKSAGEKGVDAIKTMLTDIRKGARSDMDFIRKNKSRGGINNFRLGCMFLGRGEISNAKFRFWLASQFVPRSGIVYYYMARIAFLEGKIKKSLVYLKMALYFKPRLKFRIRNFIKMASVTCPDMLDSLDIFNTGSETLPKSASKKISDVTSRRKTAFQFAFDHLSKFFVFLDSATAFFRSVFLTGKRRRQKKQGNVSNGNDFEAIGPGEGLQKILHEKNIDIKGEEKEIDDLAGGKSAKPAMLKLPK